MVFLFIMDVLGWEFRLVEKGTNDSCILFRHLLDHNRNVTTRYT